MKKILLLCLLSFSATCFAQTYPDRVSGLPRDSASQKVSFVEVVQVPGATQTELYSAAREWFSTYFTSGKAVLDMDDSQSGKLIGSGYNLFTQKMSLGVGVTRLWGTVKVYVKDGRYRYEMTDFVFAPDANPNFKTPIEEHLASKSGFLVDKNGKPKTVLQQMIDETQQQANGRIASLKKAMAASKPSAKAKDW